MRIYVVNCGRYECESVELVTTQLELAVELISERINFNSDSVFDCFSNMECWENNQRLYIYTTKSKDKNDILKELRVNYEE